MARRGGYVRLDFQKRKLKLCASGQCGGASGPAQTRRRGLGQFKEQEL